VDAARRAVSTFLADFHGVPHGRIESHLYARPDEDAVRHLFRVAAGLDSLVIGEPQILGQVKDAFAAAAEQHVTGATLNKLFHWSFAVGKRVRTETGLGEGAVSVSFAAVSLARKIFGELKGRHVTLLGAGEMSKLTAQHLKAQAVAAITVASRTAAHAEALAAEIGGEPAPWDELDALLTRADIVITATGSTRPVLTRARVEQAMYPRRTRALFVIDIAVPRDVEAAVGDIEQVFLYNIDDLQAIVSENVARRTMQVNRAEAIVDEEVARFMAWLRAREAVPTVVALRQRFEAIRSAELERLEAKLSTLTPEARQRVEEITRLIIEKLLLAPTEQLKSLSDRETVAAYSDALARLFSLDTAAPGPAGRSPAPRTSDPPANGDPRVGVSDGRPGAHNAAGEGEDTPGPAAAASGLGRAR
jgi:glutamyl-tRNA reductase